MTDRNSAPAALEARQIHFAYRPGEPVLHGVSLTARPGRLLCLLGPNGSGKTTLLRCLLGELRPSAGEVFLHGRAVRSYRARARARALAYVPQQPRSAFSFPAEEIVLMGRFSHTGALGRAGQIDRAVAREALKMTETLPLARRPLEELSGGEAQRVMIARALAQQPQVLLLDEPTSHLDMKHQIGIYAMLRRVAHDWPMAVVSVSHDVNLAARFADELLLLRAGRAAAAGAPADVVRADVLERTYDVRVELIAAPGGGVPMVRAAGDL